MLRTILSTCLLLAACKSAKPIEPNAGSDTATPVAVAGSPVTPRKAKGCAFLDEAAVKVVTGIAVTTHEHGNPQSCALFKTPAGKDYLLVATDSASA